MSFFGSAPAPNFSGAQGYMGSAGGAAAANNTLGSTANLGYNSLNNSDLQALNQYGNYLNTPSGTQQQNALYLGQAEQGSSENAAQGLANTRNMLAQNGISPNSSAGAGATTAYNTALTENANNAANQVAMWNINQYARNQAARANLYSGAANTAFGQAQSGYGAAGSEYNSLADLSTQQAMEAYQAQQANQQGQDSFLMGVGNLASNAFGGPNLFPTSPSPNSANGF